MKIKAYKSNTPTGNSKFGRPKRTTEGFLFRPDRAEWPDGTDKTKVKLGKDANSFSDYFYPLDGNESPELFLLWLQDFRTRVATNSRVAHTDKLDVLQRLLKGEAKATVKRSLERTEGSIDKITLTKDLPPPPPTNPSPPNTTGTTGTTNAPTGAAADTTNTGEDTNTNAARSLLIGEPPTEQDNSTDSRLVPTTLTFTKSWSHSNFLFDKHPIKQRLAKLTTLDQWEEYYKSEQHFKDRLNEAIHHLKFLVFGTDISGRKSYMRLRRQMHNYPVSLQHGIKKWAARMDDFQSYLPDMLWEAGEKRGDKMDAFPELKMREVLDYNLNRLQQSKLTQLDWDLSEETYRASISKLESVEAEINKEKANEDRLARLEGKPPKSSASASSPRKRKRESNYNNSPSSNTGSQISKCKICGKFHRGECRYKNSNKHSYTKKNFKKEILNVLQEAGFHTKKQKSQYDNSDSSSSDHSEEWDNGLTNNEKLFVLASAQADADDSDVSIDSATKSKYLKRYRKRSRKRLQGRNK
jgi:hypothetical protein